MRKIGFVIFSALAGFGFSTPASAQELPPLELYQQMLEINKATGWVAFRDFGGQQWIYFTSLVTLHCRIGEIRYSINSDVLDQTFPLPECNPVLPFSLPTDAGPDAIALSLPLGSADTISVQVSFAGGKKLSDILTYAPCKDVGESSCAMLVSEVAND